MTDAHCHPYDLLKYFGDAETERRESGTACAASSWNRAQFEYHEVLSKKAREENAPHIFLCFALHPQLSAEYSCGRDSPEKGFALLSSLADEGRLDAVGETGFDLYDEKFKAAEKTQDKMFAFHLETALRFGLPLVLHVRRAMHKVFPFSKELKKLPAVVFHSWPGTSAEGRALLKRGINAFFSFGTAVLKNHKEAMASAVSFPPDRILFETDAPYQPPRRKFFSSSRDLVEICQGIAVLRKRAESPPYTPEALGEITTKNFYRVFSAR